MSFGFGFSLPGWQTLSGGAFSPAQLFAAGEVGAWYDPSDLTTLFQDSAGTTPVTAVEQPVGRMLDKSGRGNHATQSTSTSRPVLRARYNLLTYSEQFDNAAWLKNSGSVSANSTVAPDGTTTADTFTSTAAAAAHNLQFNGLTTYSQANVNHTASVSVKAGTHNFVTLSFSSGSADAWAAVTVDLSTGTATKTGNGVNGTLVGTPTVVSQGSGWYRISLTARYASGVGTYVWVSSNSSNTPTYGSYGLESWTPVGTETLIVWGAQLVATNSLPSNTYQRIAAATDYNTTGFLPYLSFDGTDDSLLTNSVNFATVTSDGQARRNVLNNPTQFDVSTVWIVSNTTVSANATTSPDGGTTADLVYPATSGTNRSIYEAATVVTATTYTNSIYVKYSNIAWINLSSVQGSSARSAWFNVQTGQKGTVAGGVTADISSVGNGWYRCSVTDTSSGVTGYLQVIFASADNSTSVTANGTDGVFLWGAQLEAGSITAFQNIGTDKMTVWAGVRKLSDATNGCIAELSTTIVGNNGSYAFFTGSPTAATAQYHFTSRGTAAPNTNQAAVSTNIFVAPITNVITGTSDIAGDLTTFRANGAANGTDGTGDQGTGNYGNYPLYIGRRNNATLPLNGNLYSLIIRGAQSSAAQISSTETWVAQKTGVTL